MKLSCVTIVVWFSIFPVPGYAKDFHDKLDRFIITCHTTDFTCFKRQYKALRNNALLGNDNLGIDLYEPYTFKYGGSGTCIKMDGFENSELAGISMDGRKKELMLTLELPVKIRQVDSSNVTCQEPASEFDSIGVTKGPMKTAVGNATLQVMFPYELRKKKGQVYLVLDQEDVDIILDIPDPDDVNSISDTALDGSAARWAYQLVQHIDAAEHFALPYTAGLRSIFSKIPLERFIMLYPEEEYTDLKFRFEEKYLEEFHFGLKNIEE